MDRVYELGKHKLQTRKDADRIEQEFEKEYEACTFKPKLSELSQKMGKGSVVMSQVKQRNSELRSSQSHSVKDLGDRLHDSIQKDIERKKQAYLER